MRRQLHFAIRVPPRQLARRAALALRRRVEARLQPSLWFGEARLAEDAPLPLFEPVPSAARRTADGWQFTFLGRTASCGRQVDWSLPGPAAADQLWGMNLHYFEHAEALGDEEWADLARQWIVLHPPYEPGSTRTGWNAYALSLRVVSWLQQLAARRGRLDPPTARAIAASAARQLRYLERHLETDIGGNHLFKNITALLWGSAALDCPRSDHWRYLGLKLLRRELRQFLADGLHFERSPSYHAQVVADCLNIRHALGGDPLGGPLDAVIAKGVQAAADLAHPDGLAALFGDAGLHMARAPAALLKETRLQPQPAFAYPDAGYFGLHDGGDALIVDAGPLGPDALPGHAHGDMFAFEWSVAGERVIVDQGVFEYVAGDRRQASRTAGSHNSVAAPGADQGDFFSAFRLGARTRLAGRDVKFEGGRLELRASHSGFVGTRVRHERSIDASCRDISVVDRLSDPLEGAAASLLLAPQARPALTETGVRIDGFAVPIALETACAVTIEPAVWWPDMGVEIPTKRLRIALSRSEGAFRLTAG